MNSDYEEAEATAPLNQDRTGIPPWMQAEKISFGERIEILAYKFITYIPVMVTFGLFTFLFAYYSYVSTIDILNNNILILI